MADKHEQLPDGWMSPMPDSTAWDDLFLIALLSLPGVTLFIDAWLRGDL